MAMLAVIKLELYGIAHLFVIKITENEDRFDDLPQDGQGPRQTIRRGGICQPLDDDVGRRRAIPQRGRDPCHGVPLLANPVHLGGVVEQRVQASVTHPPRGLVELLSGKVAQPRHKRIAQQI